jgi:hypothetical protein
MATMPNTNINIPYSAFIDESTGRPTQAWLLWLMSPNFITVNLGSALAVTSGGTGLTTIPTNGQLLIGNGSGYTLNTLGTGVGISVVNGSGTITIANTGVLSFSGGTTGLTPATATTGTVTLAGTLIAVNGGTGQSLYAVGDLLYADTTTTLAKLPDVATGNALISGGVSTAPAWGKIGLTTHVSGILPIANGGTNGSATPTTNGIAYGTGTAYAFTSAGTTGQVLTATTGSAPTWASPAYSGTVTSVSFTGGIITVATPTTTPAFTVAGTSGGIVYFSSNTTWASSAALTQYGVVYGGGAGAAPVSTAAGTTGQVLTATTGGAPTWVTPTSGGTGTVTSVSVVSANGFAGTVATATTTPAITLTTSVTGVLKGNGTAISAATANTDYQGVAAPVTKTADFTVAATDIWLINNKSGSTCTVTLPTASSWSGRVLQFLNYQAQTLVSASSNVVPLTGGAAATSILLASTGDSATLVSDGTNWLMTQYIPNNILLLE